MGKFLSALACSAILVISPAHALTLVNEDQATYTVEIIEGQGSAQPETYELQYDYMLAEICDAGCTIKLSNGITQGFAGHEYVTIRDGKFVATE